MDVELQINNGATAATRFVSWAPSLCRIRVTNPSGATSPTVNVTIAGVSSASGGVVVFRAGATGSFAASLTLPVPTNGTARWRHAGGISSTDGAHSKERQRDDGGRT
jgi:hypothetical protein